MDETEAKEVIGRLCAATYDPQLDNEDMDYLAEIARTPDINGTDVDDPAWIPTYNIKRAVAHGWETKAARAAGDFRFEDDSQSFYREQVYRACREQADRYSRDMVAVPMTSSEA